MPLVFNLVVVICTLLKLTFPLLRFLARYWDKLLGTYKNPRDVAAFNKDV